MKLLFVCTGNVTRSLMAEYLAKQILTKKDEVKSAGIKPDVPWAFTFEALETRGINAREHRPAHLTQELCDWADIIIGMEQHHVDVVAEYNKHAYLFNELALGEAIPLFDDTSIPQEQFTMHNLKAFLFELCDTIEAGLPALIKRARELCE